MDDQQQSHSGQPSRHAEEDAAVEQPAGPTPSAASTAAAAEDAARCRWRDQLFITLCFAISFRQWAYGALSYLYSVEADEGSRASLCAATGLGADEYALLSGWAMSATVTAIKIYTA